MSTDMLKFVAVLLMLSSAVAPPLIACEDPCPSPQLGLELEQTAMRLWTESGKSASLWKGVSSYHASDSEAHYATFVADSNTVFVGESDCALSHPSWVFLTWEKVSDEELQTISLLEAYYQGLSPILELKKARYGKKLTLYLLRTETGGRTDWIFKLYTLTETGSQKSLCSAYAYPTHRM